jgi:thioesterase domain-containing protein
MQAAVEDIYRLTELQEAMLVHRLQRPAADSGVLLVRATLRGRLDLDPFREAWRRTLAAHPATRSSVHWQDLKHPVQVVAAEVPVEIAIEDWSALPPVEQERRLADREVRARAEGLDIGTAPVMCWSLARTGDLEHRLLWVCHHLLLDGWSSALLLAEVLNRHAALVAARPFADTPAPRFRDWVGWLRQKDDIEPQAFWQTQRFRLATPIAAGAWHEQPTTARVAVIERPVALPSAELEAVARRWRLTPANVLVGCWGLTLAETTGAEAAVFGFTTAGRTADFAGIERLVGMLANTVPIALEVEAARPIDDWLRSVARVQQHAQRFERCSLGALLRAGGYVPRRPLFDTLVTIANYPGVAAAGSGTDEALALTDFASDVTSGYPLTLAILPGNDVRLRAHYRTDALDRSQVEAVLDRFARIATAVVGGEPQQVGDLIRLTPVRPPASGSVPDWATGITAAASRGEPMRPVEQQLVRIWLALLDVKHVGLDDTFFALGGNSVLVPRLIERVRQDFGVELPLGMVFEAPTVRQLAKVVEADAADRAWRSVVPIREQGSRQPLYLMHGLEGEIGRYYDLANRLPLDQPVFGVQPPPEPSTTIEAMAARYVTEIRARQPQGPYLLGGFCIGGILAFEMARQLTASGERVAPLMLLDCLAPGPLFVTSTTILPSPGTLARMALADPQAFLDRVTKRAIRSAARLGRRAADAEVRPVELGDVRDLSAVPEVYLEPSLRHFRAARDYAPARWAGEARLLRTHDERFAGDLGWGRLLEGGIEIAAIPGSHTGAFEEPHVKEAGAALAAFLETATRYAH